MDFVREELKNLKELASSWEMDKYQIEEAIMKAIADKNGNVPADLPDEQPQGRQAKRGCLRSCLTVYSVLTLAFMCVAVGGVLVYHNYTPFEVYVNNLVGDLNYPVLRLWRHLVLPLHRYVDVQYFSAAECLVNNPYYIPEEPDCSSCEEAVDVPRIENATDFSEEFLPWGNPVIVTDVHPYMAKNYTVESFFKYYEDNKENLDKDLCEVSSLDETVDTIEDYYTMLKKLGPEAPNIRWKVCYGEGLRALRKFLPRPYFVQTEGALEKFLMIINSHEEVLPLPAGQYGNSWVAQVTGASDIELSPIPECNTTCPSFNVTLNKGEVMYLNQDLWFVDIVGNPSEETGVVLLSSFA